MFGLFAVVSVQKSVRDRLEGLPVTDIYYGLCWFATILSILLLIIGLWNAMLLPSEKGFYAFAFLLALFGAIAVKPIHAMPAPAAAAIAAQLMIEGRKYPITPLSVIMQPFDEHLLLRREPVMPGDPDILVDLFKAILTQAVKRGLGQERIRFDSHLH
jgi:hypothetical protein